MLKFCTPLESLNYYSLELGIDIGDRMISILLFADDIVLISENENDLQILLDKVFECSYKWKIKLCSYKWKIKFNAKKSNVIHFRHDEKTSVSFNIGRDYVNNVSQCKYLGIELNEFMDFDVTADNLARAGNRALGAIIN